MTRKKMKKNLPMSISIQPSEICSGPSCGFAWKRKIMRAKLNTLAMAKTPSDTMVGSSSGHRERGCVCGP